MFLCSGSLYDVIELAYLKDTVYFEDWILSFPPECRFLQESDDSTRYIPKEILLKITFISLLHDVRVARG